MSGKVASLFEFSGGGLPTDFDGTISAAYFTKTAPANYNASKPTLFLQITVDRDNEEAVEQSYSAGDLSRFEPSKDGRKAVAAEGSDSESISKSTNYFAFMKELLGLGYPVEKLREFDGDITETLVGLRGHFLRKPQQERQGLAESNKAVSGGLTGANTQAARPREVLVVTRIDSYPWENKAAGKPNGKTASAGTTTASKTAKTAVAVDADAGRAMLTNLLAAADGKPIQKGKIAGLLLTEMPGKDQAKPRMDMQRLLFDNAFLTEGANEGLWSFDGSEISVVE
jgi:hypothetical protein